MSKQIEKNQGSMCFSDPNEQFNHRNSPEVLMIRGDNNQSHLKVKFKSNQDKGPYPTSPSAANTGRLKTESDVESAKDVAEKEDY